MKKGEEGSFLERRHSSLTYKRRHAESEEEPSKVCGMFTCSDEIREMLNCSLYKDVIFIVFSLSNLLTSIGFNIPYVYLVTKATAAGIPDDRAPMLISIIGGANTIGRIVLGYISDKPWINRLWVYNWSLTICGIGKCNLPIPITHKNYAKGHIKDFCFCRKILSCNFLTRYKMLNCHVGPNKMVESHIPYIGLAVHKI